MTTCCSNECRMFKKKTKFMHHIKKYLENLLQNYWAMSYLEYIPCKVPKFNKFLKFLPGIFASPHPSIFVWVEDGLNISQIFSWSSSSKTSSQTHINEWNTNLKLQNKIVFLMKTYNKKATISYCKTLLFRNKICGLTCD